MTETCERCWMPVTCSHQRLYSRVEKKQTCVLTHSSVCVRGNEPQLKTLIALFSICKHNLAATNEAVSLFLCLWSLRTKWKPGFFARNLGQTKGKKPNKKNLLCHLRVGWQGVWVFCQLGNHVATAWFRRRSSSLCLFAMSLQCDGARLRLPHVLHTRQQSRVYSELVSSSTKSDYSLSLQSHKWEKCEIVTFFCRLKPK